MVGHRRRPSGLHGCNTAPRVYAHSPENAAFKPASGFRGSAWARRHAARHFLEAGVESGWSEAGAASNLRRRCPSNSGPTPPAWMPSAPSANALQVIMGAESRGSSVRVGSTPVLRHPCAQFSRFISPKSSFKYLYLHCKYTLLDSYRMDRVFEHGGTTFRWDELKAEQNHREHGVSFEEAVTVFDDPLFCAARCESKRGTARRRNWLQFGGSIANGCAYRVRRRIHPDHFCVARFGGGGSLL